MKRDKKSRGERIKSKALNATEWIGSSQSLVVHSLLFVIAFLLPFLGVSIDRVLLVLTTAVSLEAVYLAIFIQMSVNKNTEDIEEIHEDVEEISEDIDEIQKDVDEIQKDVEGIEEEVKEISEEIDEDQEEDKQRDKEIISTIEKTLAELIKEINSLKNK